MTGARIAVLLALAVLASPASAQAQPPSLECSQRDAKGRPLCVQIPPLAPATLHQFGTDDQQLDPLETYLSGDLGACNRRSLMLSAAPIACLATDWLNLRSYDASVTPTFQIGGSWATGDRIGIDAWIGDAASPTGALAEYRVLYTVQAGDISGGGSAPAAYARILAGLAGTDQSGIGDGGCVNGTGGYHRDGRVPAAPAHCTGTSTFLAAMAHFPDGGPLAGSGYRPQAFATGPYFIADFPWGNATTGVFAAHPVVNVLKPLAVSAAGTFTVLQRTNANLHQQLFAASGGVLDNGPIASLKRINPGRTPQAGDMLSSYRIDLQNTTDGKSGFAGPAFVAGVDGLSAIVAAVGRDRLVLAAAPTGPPSLAAEFAAGSNWYAADNSWACAIPMGTTVAGWDKAALTVTLSRAIDGAPPCPGVAKGDLISFVNINDPRALSGIAGPGGTPIMFFGEGFVTTGTGGPNQACAPPPGYGSGIICGTLEVAGRAASTSPTTGALTVAGGLGVGRAIHAGAAIVSTGAEAGFNTADRAAAGSLVIYRAGAADRWYDSAYGSDVFATDAHGAMWFPAATGGSPGKPGYLNMAGCRVNDVPCASTRDPTASKTARYALQPSDSGTSFDNTGAAGEVDFLLPAAAEGLDYCFTVVAPHRLRVVAPTPARIAIGTSNSIPAGHAAASAAFSALCLYAPHGATAQWVAKSATGKWVVN